MKESLAWLVQVDSDWSTAELLASNRFSDRHCQEISKYQQVTEKAINVIDAVMREQGIIIGRARAEHYPVHMMNRLKHLTRRGAATSVEIVQNIVLERKWQSEIFDLCRLAPRLPEPGVLYSKNTEYPFNPGAASDDWSPPARAFAASEVERFRRVASHLRGWAHRIYSFT